MKSERAAGHVGFTGTQRGMTPEQLKDVHQKLSNMKAHGFHTFHHGDCVGADQQAHVVAVALGFKVVVHPPSDDKLRAHCEGDEVLPAKPYLDRNRDIVESVSYLIAAPKQVLEVQRSGTWATIRYARKWGIPITVTSYL